MVAKTVLITGGLGYLGGRFSQYFAEIGYRVFVGSSRTDAELPFALKECSLVHTDFNDVASLTNVLSEVDSIVHLASLNAKQSLQDPQLAIKVNGIGMYNLIQASTKTKIEHLLYFSTAHIYGSSLIGQVTENTLPRPTNPYAITHRLAEDILMAAIANGDIRGTVIRLSNAIGMPITKEVNCWMLFVNDACKQAIVSQRIVINANPRIRRDFIPVNSVCKISEYLLCDRPLFKDPLLNVGSGVSYSLLSIAEIIADRCQLLFGFHPEILFSDDSLNTSECFDYRVDKLISKMGYSTNNDLNSPIDEVLNFCFENFSKI